MKCVYTSDETNALLSELQKDKTFVLSNFFAIAVKDYYNNKVKKVSNIGEQLEKAKLNLNVAESKFNEVNKKAVEEASQKAQEELDKQKETEQEVERWTVYARKTLTFNKLEYDEKIVSSWVEQVIKCGAKNVDGILTYYNNMKGGQE